MPKKNSITNKTINAFRPIYQNSAIIPFRAQKKPIYTIMKIIAKLLDSIKKKIKNRKAERTFVIYRQEQRFFFVQHFMQYAFWIYFSNGIKLHFYL
jgi:hypothetical protein